MKKTIFKLLALTLALLMLLPLTMACKKDEEKQNGGESNSVSTEGDAHPVPLRTSAVKTLSLPLHCGHPTRLLPSLTS